MWPDSGRSGGPMRFIGWTSCEAGVTIGSMSEPDAVPLPREGAVFFDVRGEARSMRLSWYADSAVAVFSIWQGNRCTGTFRLPFGELARMVETLQSGPPSQAAHATPRQLSGAAFAGPHEAYQVAPSHRAPAPGYTDQPGYPARGQSAGAPPHPRQSRYQDANANLAAEPVNRGNAPGYSDHGYQDESFPPAAYPDRYNEPAYPDPHQPAGYQAAERGAHGRRNSPDYQGAPGYPRTGQYYGEGNYRGDYQDAAGYSDRGGYPGAGDYASEGGYTDPLGHRDGPNYHQAAPTPEYSQPTAAAQWPAAPAAGQQPGRHGAAHAADGDQHAAQSPQPRTDQQDSDWEAATAAYRSL
jgi:hypothetical protein